MRICRSKGGTSIMKILIACEESQAVCKAFREKGHEAYSCDIVECSGGHPEWHIRWDALALLNGNCSFLTCDGEMHTVNGKRDMLIAFPPCTDLAVSGARHFEKKRADGRQRASIEFFAQFLNADCDKVVIENPIGIISGDYIQKWFPDLAEKYGLPIKQSQIIQPYEYGHASKKATCLWIKGLPLLKPTEIVEPDLVSYTCKSGKKVTFSRHMVQGFENGERAKSRSKTFEGVAKAMAEQWGVNNVPRYIVKAYANAEYGLKSQTVTITAENYEEAERKAFNMFDEYEEIGVWEDLTNTPKKI